MDIAQQKPATASLKLARHAALMAVAALANPLVYYDSNPVEAWAIPLVGAAVISAVLFGVLAIIQPQRAKQAFPMTPIKSAWLILVLMILANWQSSRTPAAPPHQTSLKPSCKVGATEVDAFLDDCQR